MSDNGPPLVHRRSETSELFLTFLTFYEVFVLIKISVDRRNQIVSEFEEKFKMLAGYELQI